MSFSYLLVSGSRRVPDSDWVWRYREEEKMKKTENTRQNCNLKRGISLLLSFMMSFVFLMANGCDNKPAVIEDYPDTQPVSTVDTGDGNVTVEIFEEGDTTGNAEEKKRADDSLFDSGAFIYNPEAINPTYEEEMKNKQESYKAAKNILKAVYNRETVFELTGDDEVDEMDFNRGLKLARYSSPMVSCIDITITDKNTYKISYFPVLSEDHSELYESDTDMADVERKYTAFEEYVAEAINNNITADDDYMERAEKIYKFMMDDIELVYDEEILEQAAYTNPFPLMMAFYDTNILDVPETHKLNHWQFMLLYDFFLTQLNVKHIIVAGWGAVIDAPVESISEAYDITQDSWSWMIITDENDNSFNCDILMDKMVLDEQRKAQADYESDMLFFGMSDKTRKESVDLRGRAFGLTMDSIKNDSNPKFPQCKEDYKK